MKIYYDENSDAVFIRLNDKKKIIESQEVESGIILDYDENHTVIGVEILKMRDRIDPDQLRDLKFKAVK